MQIPAHVPRVVKASETPSLATVTGISAPAIFTVCSSRPARSFIARVDGEEISADPRSRRRRTIEAGQLAPALEGTATHAYALSFILTNIATHNDPNDGESVLDVEAWFRPRTDIEDRIGEAKLGAELRHLPSGYQAVNQAVNQVWTWAALLASWPGSQNSQPRPEAAARSTSTRTPNTPRRATSAPPPHPHTQHRHHRPRKPDPQKSRR